MVNPKVFFPRFLSSVDVPRGRKLIIRKASVKIFRQLKVKVSFGWTLKESSFHLQNVPKRDWNSLRSSASEYLSQFRSESFPFLSLIIFTHIMANTCTWIMEIYSRLCGNKNNKLVSIQLSGKFFNTFSKESVSLFCIKCRGSQKAQAKLLNLKEDEMLLLAQLIDSNGVGCVALKILLHCNKFSAGSTISSGESY